MAFEVISRTYLLYSFISTLNRRLVELLFLVLLNFILLHWWVCCMFSSSVLLTPNWLRLLLSYALLFQVGRIIILWCYLFLFTLKRLFYELVFLWRDHQGIGNLLISVFMELNPMWSKPLLVGFDLLFQPIRTLFLYVKQWLIILRYIVQVIYCENGH